MIIVDLCHIINYKFTSQKYIHKGSIIVPQVYRNLESAHYPIIIM